MAAMSRASPGRGAPADAGAVRSAPDGCGASPASEFGGKRGARTKRDKLRRLLSRRQCAVALFASRAGEPQAVPSFPLPRPR